VNHATENKQPIGILCVDDNPRVAKALRAKLSHLAGFAWRGWVPNADTLVEQFGDDTHVVLLDIDMPGRDPLDALADLMSRRPDVRAIIFSGHVRKDLIAAAIDSGAWGYVSKNDGEDALISALRAVAAGEFALSPEVHTSWRA
jgi:DNA-binding NarL/FixJ family response regulator